MTDLQGNLTAEVDGGIIGRGVELEAILRFLDPTAPGPGALVLVGESGIGKTTLWRQALTAAESRYHQVLTCRPAQSEVRLSFGALTDLFGEISGEELSQLPDPQRRALRAALLLEEPEGIEVDERAVSAGLLGLLRTMSAAGPILVAADDIQWLDEPSARALGFALRRVEQEPIRMLAVERRQIDQSGKATLIEMLPRDSVAELPVGPLAISIDEVDLLLRTQLGASMRRHLLTKLHSAAGGNPMFILEMARALQRGGSEPGPGQPLPVPQSLADLLRDRLAALPAPTLRAIQVASMPWEPTVSTIVATLERAREPLSEVRPEDRVRPQSEPSLNPVLDVEAAVDAGVLELSGEFVRFSHPLLGLVAYSDTPTSDRRVLHRLLAQVVADPEERARHLALSASAPDEEVSRALDEAAHRAMARGAPSSAAELAELAWQFTPTEQEADRIRRMVDAADYRIECGQMDAGRRLLEQVIRDAPAGPVRARARLLLGDSTNDPRQAIRLLDGALAEAAGDHGLEIGLHMYLVSQYLSQGHIQTAATHAEAQRSLAEQWGGPGDQAAGMVNVAETRFVLGLGLDTELLGRARNLGGDSRHEQKAAWLLSSAGEIDSARRVFDTLLARARDNEVITAGTNLWMSDLEYRAGNWKLAKRLAEAGHALGQMTNWEPMIPWSLVSLARVLAGFGDADAARDMARRGIEGLEKAAQTLYALVFAHPLLGFIELSLGNYPEVVRLLAPLQDRCAELGLGEPSFMRFVPDLVEGLVATGDLKQARRALQPFAKRSREVDRPFGLATAARCRALILAGSGDTEGALKGARESLAEHSRLAEPFEEGRTLVVLGDLYRRRKHKQAARESLEQAKQIFDRVGARLWSERASGGMERLGKRPESQWHLSPTEQRVAELVAAGGTNQEVADALFLSPRTVAANLTKIYAKLGVRSRTEMARKVTGMTPP